MNKEAEETISIEYKERYASVLIYVCMTFDNRDNPAALGNPIEGWPISCLIVLEKAAFLFRMSSKDDTCWHIL